MDSAYLPTSTTRGSHASPYILHQPKTIYKYISFAGALGHISDRTLKLNTDFQHTPPSTTAYMDQLVRSLCSSRNCPSCTGFVSRLANINFVPRCLISTSCRSTLSVTQNSRMAMCRDRSEVGRPFFTSAMQLKLS